MQLFVANKNECFLIVTHFSTKIKRVQQNNKKSTPTQQTLNTKTRTSQTLHIKTQ